MVTLSVVTSVAENYWMIEQSRQSLIHVTYDYKNLEPPFKITLRGFNSVLKTFPWYEEDLLLPSRQEELASLGFNVVRLGAMWTGIEPERGNINYTYVNVLKVGERWQPAILQDTVFLPLQDLVSSLSSRGIYTILDLHQDVLWEAGNPSETHVS